MNNNMFASIFGESPATQQAKQTRDNAFQAMLASRRQAAEQQRTDAVKMARWNALGNLLITMVQPIGWGIGGKGSGVTGGVQQYDNRQYLDSFNRALKASDDLQNIGTAEDQYRFNLAEEDYKRKLALEDAERKRQQDLEDSERKYNFQLEKQERQFEHQREIQEQKDDARRALEEYKATHRVSRKGTGGMGVEDRILLKEIDAYNKYVNTQTALGKPYDSFDKWMDSKGYQVDNVRSQYSGYRGNAGSSGTGVNLNLQ